MNILFKVEANPVQMRCQCFYSTVKFSICDLGKLGQGNRMTKTSSGLNSVFEKPRFREGW